MVPVGLLFTAFKVCRKLGYTPKPSDIKRGYDLAAKYGPQVAEEVKKHGPQAFQEMKKVGATLLNAFLPKKQSEVGRHSYAGFSASSPPRHERHAPAFAKESVVYGIPVDPAYPSYGFPQPDFERRPPQREHTASSLIQEAVGFSLNAASGLLSAAGRFANRAAQQHNAKASRQAPPQSYGYHYQASSPIRPKNEGYRR